MTTYTKPTLVNYNDNPPTNDGSEDDVNNLVDWDKRTIAEVGDPLKDYIDSVNNETFDAFNLVEAKYATSVKDSDYGATGDGSTDDATAIQAAIDAVEAAGGGVVYFPKGEYLVKSGLVIDSNNVYLVGEGRGSEITYDLTLGQTVDVIKFSAVVHGGVSKLYINCSNADATAGNGALAVRGASSFIAIEDVVVNDHNSGIILEDPVTDCWVNRCSLDGQLRHNMRQIGLARCWITNNVFTGAAREPIAFNASNSATMKDIYFLNNYLEAPNSFDFVIVVSSATPTYTRLHFTGNKFIDGGTAQSAINSNGFAFTLSDVSNNIISGGGIGLELYLLEDSTITGNRISGCEEAGITVFGANNNIISNNIIKNCDQISATSNKGGIALRLSSSTGSINNTITGNRCYDDQGTKTQTYGIKINDAASIDNEINGNNLDGNLTGKISDVGVANRVDTPSSEYAKTLDNTGTPSVDNGHYFITSGTTGITNFIDGIDYQVIVVLFGHAVTVTDGTNIFLHGGANQAFTSGDSLTLILKADKDWYELARSVS